MVLVGVAGAVDWECWSDTGGKRSVLHAAADPYWTNTELHHPADIPLHLWEQEDGHHSASESLWSMLSFVSEIAAAFVHVDFLWNWIYFLVCQKAKALHSVTTLIKETVKF